jgi:GDP-4-dehydro-6-deoxy-D-mannose reductase
MPRTVLVTGAAGFVGRHLLADLTTRDTPEVLVAWRRPGATAVTTLHSDTESAGVRWDEVDIMDREAVGARLEAIHPDGVYHCAGIANVHGSWEATLGTLEVNVRGTAHLLDAVERLDTPTRVLIPGSALVYKPAAHALSEDAPIGPVSPYGLSKLAQEMLGRHAANRGSHIVIARAFTHIGPGQDLSFAASSFASQVARIEAGLCEPVIEVGFLDARRDLMDVRDTVRAYRALMTHGETSQPYNVCTGVPRQIRDVLDGLIAQSTASVEVRVDPGRLRPNDNPLLLGDPGRIVADVGWRPEIPFEQTLRDLLAFWRDSPAT